MTQLIVLDILHENIPKEKINFLYEQLFKFLKDKQTLEIEKELIDNKIDILVSSLDKKTQFLNYIYSLNEKKKEILSIAPIF